MPRPERGIGRIAVLRSNGIGDLLFAFPALDALRAAYPEAEITLLATEWHRELLLERPGPVDRVIAVPISRGVNQKPGEEEDPVELDRFFAAMREERFDIALQMHGGGGWSNPFVSKLGAGLTAGARAEDAPALDRWIRYVYYQSEVMRNLEVAALVGATPVTIEPRLTPVASDVEEAAPWLGGARPLVVLHPGAGDARRRWAPAHFAQVGDALAAAGARVLVTGTPPERAVVQAVVEKMAEPASDLCGRLSLRGLAGLLSRCDLLVSNDSGPLHLGVAVGAPSVGIFWIANVINGALPTRARMRPIPSFRLDCPVCGVSCITGSCEHDASFVDDAPVGEVLAAARDLLSIGRAAPAVTV